MLTPRRAVAIVAALPLVWVGVPTVDRWACHVHEAREGFPVQPEGRIVGDLSQDVRDVRSLATRPPAQDASFDPADPRYRSWRVVHRMASTRPSGTVLEVSACAPIAPWHSSPHRRYYLTVAA